MKTIFKKISFAFALVAVLFSCTEDNLQPEGQWELTEAQIIYPEIDETIVLDQNNPMESISFQWSEAVSSENYLVTYSVVIDTLDSTDFSTPIIEVESNNNGKSTNAEITFQALDEALSVAGYPANAVAELTLAVKATSLSKNSFGAQKINLQRFESETLPTELYISGTAAENNANLQNAIPLKQLNNAEGEPSAIFETYTRLNSEGSFSLFTAQSLPAIVYGGNNGNISRDAEGIQVEETGEYRVQVDLENETYNLLKIDYWSVVGSVIEGGWDGDQALAYQGDGVWRSTINLVETGNFVFRANGSWDYLLKRVIGTQLNVVMESQAESQGLNVEDIPSNNVGSYFVTLDLSANAYTFLIELDDSEPEPIQTPDQLFLLSNNDVVQEFTKDGDQFSSPNFIPLQSGVNYTLNSQQDGNGISYAIAGNLIGESANPDADQVSENSTLLENNASFTLNSDRSLRLNFDFSTSSLNWAYYNFKLFHWNNWESRDEFPMTYVHPNQYTITIDIEADYEMKFISPWDFDMGSTSPNSLTGEIVNGSGENLAPISTGDSYEVSISLNDDYQAGTYTFE